MVTTVMSSFCPQVFAASAISRADLPLISRVRSKPNNSPDRFSASSTPSDTSFERCGVTKAANLDGLRSQCTCKQCEECGLHMVLRTVTTVMSSFWPPALAALAICCADLPLIFSKVRPKLTHSPLGDADAEAVAAIL